MSQNNATSNAQQYSEASLDDVSVFDLDGSNANNNTGTPSNKRPRENVVGEVNEPPRKKKKPNNVARTMDTVLADLKCPICQDCLHNPVTTVSCFHNFCRSCFYAWSKDKDVLRCPFCARVQNRSPRKNVTLNNIAEAVIQNLDSEDDAKKSYMERAKLEQDHEQTLYESLENLTEKFKQQNAGSTQPKLKYANIHDKWTADTSYVFRKFVKNYPYGKARKRYCEISNFTSATIKAANQEQLQNMFINLNLAMPRKRIRLQNESQATVTIDEEEAKLMLLEYLEMDLDYTTKRIVVQANMAAGEVIQAQGH